MGIQSWSWSKWAVLDVIMSMITEMAVVDFVHDLDQGCGYVPYDAPGCVHDCDQDVGETDGLARGPCHGSYQGLCRGP